MKKSTFRPHLSKIEVKKSSIYVILPFLAKIRPFFTTISATSDLRPMTSRLATSDQQPAIGNQQSATSSQQPADRGQPGMSDSRRQPAPKPSG
ncbi:hypothetical protein [Paenibacillus macerans]|uniref:hypothetical protein n=1 Tax=Paenibacillus macerans TaxID=44252 RepID=UPI0020412A50|nr:hypothetical protein [Paenibacillus macerans]MCM3698942.1 hypothetical protein [Paenibacillus macerans]